MQKPAFSYDELVALAEPFELTVLYQDENNLMTYVICGKTIRIVLRIARFDDGNQPANRLLHRYGTLDGEGFFHPVIPTLFVPLCHDGIPESWNTTSDINEVMQAATYEREIPRVWNVADATMEKVRLLAEQHGRCAYCGKHMKACEITLDHVIPHSRGGQHEPGNWCLACKKCNDTKADMLPDEFSAKRVLTS